MTALHLAASYDKDSFLVAQRLLAAGAAVNLKNDVSLVSLIVVHIVLRLNVMWLLGATAWDHRSSPGCLQELTGYGRIAFGSKSSSRCQGQCKAATESRMGTLTMWHRMGTLHSR